MSNKSPLTEIIVDPICKKIFNNLNFNGIMQLGFIFLLASIYYIINENSSKSSVIYLLFFFCWNCISSSSQNNDITLFYFLINLLYQIYILRQVNFKSDIVIISLIISVLCICSYSITRNLEKNNSPWDNFVNKVNKSIYPKNDETKKYHINNFWKIFDFSFFSLFIFVLINIKKK